MAITGSGESLPHQHPPHPVSFSLLLSTLCPGPYPNSAFSVYFSSSDTRPTAFSPHITGTAIPSIARVMQLLLLSGFGLGKSAAPFHSNSTACQWIRNYTIHVISGNLQRISKTNGQNSIGVARRCV